MKSLNKIQLIGNLGVDPETRHSSSGTVSASFSLATSETWKDKQSGEMQERTEWHRVKCFGRLAEVAGEYLKKGHRVYVEGRVHYSTYTDKEGVERYGTEIVVNDLIMLTAAGAKDAAVPSAAVPGPALRPVPHPTPAAPAHANSAPIPDDDDIPF